MTAPQGSIVPPRAGRVLLVVCWLAVLYGTVAVIPHPLGARGVGAWIAVAVFLLTFTRAVERPGSAILLPLAGGAGVVMQFCAPGNGAFVAVIAAIALTGTRLDTSVGRRAAAVIGVGFLAASISSAHPPVASQVVAMVPALLFTYLGSAALRRLRVEQARTQTLLEEAIAGRDARVHAATLDERAHLAREMHDVLAHTLSALSIQLEGTGVLAEQRSCDPAVVAALARASGLAREGLGEARRAVGSLRGETLPGPDLLPQLTQEFERDTGVPCRLQVEGTPLDLTAETRLALFRIAQEALTNVRKHAQASGVTVTLRYTEHAIELGIDDVGAPLPSPLPGGGYGLSGMRERAELLGGRLEAAPTDEGFNVWLWIPTRTNGVSAS